MNKTEIFKEIRKIIYYRYVFRKINENDIKITDSLDTLLIDSLDILFLLLDIEEKFNMTISDDILISIKTIEEIVDYIHRSLN